MIASATNRAVARWREFEPVLADVVGNAGDSPAEVAAADEVNAAWRELNKALRRLDEAGRC